MHGSTVQALALAHRIFEHLRFRLNVDQRAPEVVAAELRERCHALQTRPDGLASYRAAWELVWRGPDLGDCAASEDLVERLADVYAETGLRVADRLLDGARRDELVALSDHLTGLAERLVVDGAQAVADALESPDPWERDVAAAIGRDRTLPGPSERASPEGRIRALLDGLAPYPRDAACRDLWAAVAGGQALPDDALDRITEAVATAHVLNARLLVRSALVHALRTGTARTWPESWADHLASALVHVDAHGADPLPTLLTLQPWTGSAKESALCAWVRPDPTARFARLLPWLDVESGPAILATLQRFAGLVLDAGSTGLLARALLEGSADARRRAAEVLRAAADAEGIAARWRSDLVIRALHSTLEDPDPQ